jgi:hypothetical protein
MTAVNVPRGNPAVTASRARTAFRPDPYSFDTDSNRTAYDGEEWSGFPRLCNLMPSDARRRAGRNRYPAPPEKSYSRL